MFDFVCVYVYSKGWLRYLSSSWCFRLVTLIVSLVFKTFFLLSTNHPLCDPFLESFLLYTLLLVWEWMVSCYSPSFYPRYILYLFCLPFMLRNTYKHLLGRGLLFLTPCSSLHHLSLENQFKCLKVPHMVFFSIISFNAFLLGMW